MYEYLLPAAVAFAAVAIYITAAAVAITVAEEMLLLLPYRGCIYCCSGCIYILLLLLRTYPMLLLL
jgi:hypothetical protein